MSAPCMASTLECPGRPSALCTVVPPLATHLAAVDGVREEEGAVACLRRKNGIPIAGGRDDEECLDRVRQVVIPFAARVHKHKLVIPERREVRGMRCESQTCHFCLKTVGHPIANPIRRIIRVLSCMFTASCAPRTPVNKRSCQIMGDAAG